MRLVLTQFALTKWDSKRCADPKTTYPVQILRLFTLGAKVFRVNIIKLIVSIAQIGRRGRSGGFGRAAGNLLIRNQAIACQLEANVTESDPERLHGNFYTSGKLMI